MSKWSLNRKIFFIVGILIVGSVTIAFMGLKKMNEIKSSLDNIVHGPATRIGNAHEIKEGFFLQVINEKNLILEDTNEGIGTMLKRLNDQNAILLDMIKDAKKISTPRGIQDLEKFEGLYKQWWEMDKSIQQLISESKTQEAFVISKTKGREYRIAVEDLMDEIVKRNEGFMLTDMQEADEDYTLARNLVLMISLISIVSGILLSILILRQINRAIGEVVKTLTAGSSEVTSAAQMIASSSEELSEAATEQAASLEETSSSISEMNSMVQKNAESAKRTSDLANSSTGSAEKGKQVVREMIQAIDNISMSNNNIKAQIDESNDKIGEIVKVIGEIGNKTKVINDIVFQTKLLSFNASVEAARAGEHGKGFAVVAQEVGSLAEMSGNAAKEISDMLEGSIQKVDDIVNETKTKVSTLIVDGKEKVEVGTKIAQQCGTVLNEIVDNISHVGQMAGEIATASHEQALGVQEITKAINQLDQVTQMNAAASEQVASSAEELSGQSGALQNAVKILNEVINGGGESKPMSTHPLKKPEQTILKKNNVIPLKKKETPKIIASKGLPSIKATDVSAVPNGDDPRFEEA